MRWCNTFGIIGTPEDTFDEIKRRYGDICSRVTVSLPDGVDPDRRAELFGRLR